MKKIQDAAVGDDVFYFSSHGKYPVVKKVVRATQNFLFISFTNSVGVVFETKFRRDGSGMERYDGRICTINEGEIEKFELQKKNELRINEIINFLNGKGFSFRGYPAWFSIEQWEKLAAAIA